MSAPIGSPPAPPPSSRPEWGALPMSPRALTSFFRKQGLLHNMLALGGLQFFRKTMPLILLPYLARVLGPSGWGLVAFFQGFAACLILLVEFGFGLSATREIARCRESPKARAEVFAGVLGAQWTLALVGASAALLLSRWIPALNGHPEMLYAGLLYAVAEGCNPYWYFLGMEKMGIVAGMEIVCKSVATAAIFILVSSPEHAWRVLALQATAPVLALAFAITLAYRTTPFHPPNPSMVVKALKGGWAMFLFRSAESLYMMANAFLLGLFAPPAVVGYFAGAEKISRGMFGLFNPIRDTLYPRISHIMQKSPAEAGRLARIGMALVGSGGLLLGVAVWILAPWIVRLLMGPQFAPAVGVVRVLAVLPPILSVTQALGLQWLLPLGKERVVNRIMLCAGILNISLALLLCPRFEHMGMAWAVVASESFVCCSMIAAVAADPSRHYLLRRSVKART